ncbi:MAG: hypothetical protein E3K36_17040 [Candidatus Brocadia sp.]|nr:hypothetical protein [Candidatus Brocadia sp.]
MGKFVFWYRISLGLLVMGFSHASRIYGQEILKKEMVAGTEVTIGQEARVAFQREESGGVKECQMGRSGKSEGNGINVQPVDQPENPGVLVLAHGVHHMHGERVHEESNSEILPVWNASVLEVVKPLTDKYPLEIAFGMADPDTIKEAVQKLEEKGISEVIVVPLFISSHSPIIGNFRYILGIQEKLPETTTVKSLPRIESKIKFRMSGALDDSMLVAEILLERAMELSTNPPNETVILAGHGPNDEKENKLWLADMEKLAYYVREKGNFKKVKVATWRSDAPEEIRERAIQELRTMVEMSGKEGMVIVIPHLLATGGVESEIVAALKGLPYIFSGKTLLPHSNITRWIEMQIQEQMKESTGRKR